jgi:hypothetical protein
LPPSRASLCSKLPRIVRTPETNTLLSGLTYSICRVGFTAQYADAVFTISEDGQLLPYQFSAEKSSEDRKADDEGPNKQEEAAECEEGSSLKEAEFADPASVRDRDVYKLYFKTIGLVHMTIFILATMAFAVALRFNGPLHPTLCLDCT